MSVKVYKNRIKLGLIIIRFNYNYIRLTELNLNKIYYWTTIISR